jgi:hypothetical protein
MSRLSRGEGPARAAEVQGALGEDQIVEAEVRLTGIAREVDDPADTVEHPLRISTLAMTVRVRDTPEVTMVPSSVSLPVAAAAGTADAIEAASAIPQPAAPMTFVAS